MKIYCLTLLAICATLHAADFTVPGSIASGSSTIASNSTLNAATVFNVKYYGAKGDARKVTDAVISATNTVTSATANFTSADIGKVIWGVETATGSARLPVCTITAVIATNSITVSTNGAGSYTSISLVFGTDDSDAIRAAVAAAKPVFGTVYAPSGGYVFSKLLVSFVDTAISRNIAFLGAGSGQTIFYPSPNFDMSTTAAGSGGLLVTAHDTTNIPSNVTLAGFQFDGSDYAFDANHFAVSCRLHNSTVSDLTIRNSGQLRGLYAFQGPTLYTKLWIENCRQGLAAVQVGATFIGCYVGNDKNIGIYVDTITGIGNGGAYFRYIGGIIDECTQYSVYILNTSTDVDFTDTKIWAGVGGYYAVLMDNTASVARFTSCEIGPYGSNSNSGGLQVSAAAKAYLHNCRIYGSSPAYGLNNAGTVYDMGGNSIGTTTGTAATGIPVPSVLFGTNVLGYSGTNLTWNGTAITVP